MNLWELPRLMAVIFHLWIGDQTVISAFLILETKERRCLTDFKDPNEQAYYSSWSPDGEQIAYFWWEFDKDQYNLSIVDVKNSKSRVLLKSENADWIELGNWSSDGKYILLHLVYAGNQ